ncbi:hypothetical protein BT96DRAFT_927104 [Gymnopus androsaceus JB14]|uniref:Uncharacterized protein n=1 Tax=Gymnopus androsaceus JB14 TaxID=1447944 RepID=A0A6A4GTD4_9AGAR|nr:hypothetical protein BT96DRAFT_927104 [Gymnopus androsaceus JB14]
MHLASSLASLGILSLVSIVCAAPQPFQRNVLTHDELIHVRDPLSDGLPVGKTSGDCYKAKSAENLEQLITKAASSLGLPSGKQWKFEYSATSKVTLKDSTPKISFTGPKICGGRCTASDLGGLRPTIVDSKNLEIYPHLDLKLMKENSNPTDPSHEPVQNPAVQMKDPFQVEIDAYYNRRTKETGRVGKMAKFPKPPAATALEELITEAAPKLGLPSDGTWKFKYSSNPEDLPTFANADFKGVVPFTGPKGKYSADLAENTIKDDHGTVILEAERPTSSKSDVAAA